MCYYTHKLYKNPSRKKIGGFTSEKIRRKIMASSLSSLPIHSGLTHEKFIDDLFTFCNYEKLEEELELTGSGRIKERKDFYGDRILRYLKKATENLETRDQLAEGLIGVL